jgi:hypothetical protein
VAESCCAEVATDGRRNKELSREVILYRLTWASIVRKPELDVRSCVYTLSDINPLFQLDTKRGSSPSGVICVLVGLYGLALRVTVAGSAFLCPDTQADGAYWEL